MDGQSAAVPKRSPEQSRLTDHYGWVRAVARNLVRDPWGAEDVTQETILAALAAPPRDVPDDQRMRAWLGRVAFNLSRLGARQGARRRAREVRVARREALPSVTDELEIAGTLQALSGAIADLPEPYRGVILMRYFDGLSTAEIAARTSSSELAVRKRLWRARNKLRGALEHDPASGRLLAALLPWSWIARRARLVGLGSAAAGVALVAGATWWSGRSERQAFAALAAAGVERAEPALAELPLSNAPEPGTQLAEPPARVPSGRPVPPPAPPAVPPSVVVTELPAAFARGVVLDLEGEVRAGLELFDPAAPGAVLATSDALGGFSVPLRAGTFELAARAPGWATIAPARIAAADAAELRALVVASARDLGASVHAESGRPLAAAELELRCDESAFARIPYPVRLDGARLELARTDERGRAFLADLPRGPGLTLSIRAPGFEDLDVATPELGGAERFFLRALGAETIVAGRVLFRDGRPVPGASVTLGLESTTADESGRFRLPAAGVHPDASLGARDPRESAAPVELRAFGARLSGGVADVELVLGEEQDRVEGRLVGDEPADWLVVAYRRTGARVDARGDELPAASAYSAADGAFAFRLPRGAYDLYAVAPDGPRLARGEGLETRARSWRIELAEPAALEGFRAELRADDGSVLARAALDVNLLLDGASGPRRVTWKTLTSDEQGAVAFTRDPSLRLELALAHAAVGARSLVLATPEAELLLVVPRAAYVQVAGAAASASSVALLDAGGHVLTARGPLRAGASFALRDGWSPVLEVPPDARWLAVADEGPEPLLVPVEPRPGHVVQVRPADAPR